MTVQSQTSRADYTGNGATTSFAVPFYFLADTDLKVLRTDSGVATTLVLGTDYTVSGAGNPAGGSVSTTVAPTSLQKLSILRNVPYTQLTHYVPNDQFPAASHEKALDKLTMEIQQLAEGASRALTLPPNTTGVSTLLPPPEPNLIIGWNEEATALRNVSPSEIATIVAYGDTKADQFTGDGVTTNFTLTSSPGGLNNLDVSIGGVTQRPSFDYAWDFGTHIVFVVAPPAPSVAGDKNVLVRYAVALPQQDSTLREELASPTGVGLVGGAQWKNSVTVTEAGSFAAAVATGKHVDVDVDVVLSTIVTSAAANQVIRGAGGKLAINTDTGRYRQIHAGAQVHNLNVETTGGLYAITNEAADTLVYNTTFTGPVGHYVLSVDAPRAGVLLCKSIDGLQITPFVFQNCTDFKASMNELINHRGFGVQARWCDGGNMSLNTVRNPLYRYTKPAVNGQATYTFTVPAGGHARYGFYIQDANGAIGRVATITLAGTTVTVVTTEPSVTGGGGPIAVLVGCDALESYQINSGCKNVRIENNFSDGTGDSNVVVGADYHFDGAGWVLAPGSVVPTDFPYNSVVSDNTLKNALFANISVNNSTESVSIYSNHCYYAGFSKDFNQVLDCNINCSAAGSIIGNDCHADAAVIRTRAGIASAPLAMATYSLGGELIRIGGNKFYGGFLQGQYQLAATSIGNDRRIGVKVDGEYKKYESLLVPILATAWVTKPANDAYWSFANTAAGWGRNTTDQIIGAQCVSTIGGSSVDCAPSFFKDFAEGGIVLVRVKAKGTGYIQVYTNFAGGSIMPEVITFAAEATFVTKELYMSVKSFTELFLRIGSNGSDVMVMQDASIEFLPLSC